MPHKKCLYEGEDGCKLIASFGYPGFGTRYCSKHKEDKMINLICKLCFCGKKRPTYNFEGQVANFCSECKEDDMINVNDKRCSCGKVTPSFNFPGLKAEFCSKCRKEGMINVNDEPCVCGKSTRPCFNYPGEKPKYCSKCQSPGMIDVCHKNCKCGNSQPSFNYEGLVPEYCGKCKLPGMKMIRKRLCKKCNVKQATYNYEGKKAEFCNSCKTEEMINVVDKCKSGSCYNTGNIKYRYYCTFCFQHLFPEDPLTLQIRQKTKENAVRDFINECFEGFKHDQVLWTGNCDCSNRRRIDHRKLIGNTLLCIETDEFQHKRYDKTDEEIRYDDLYMLHGGKFIFIRFNPDKYYNSNGTLKNPYMKIRLSVLYDEINNQIERIKKEENTELLEIVHLFYDGCETNYGYQF